MQHYFCPHEKKMVKKALLLSNISRIIKTDVSIAKNYLNEEELTSLYNLVEQYLIFEQGQTIR